MTRQQHEDFLAFIGNDDAFYDFFYSNHDDTLDGFLGRNHCFSIIRRIFFWHCDQYWEEMSARWEDYCFDKGWLPRGYDGLKRDFYYLAEDAMALITKDGKKNSEHLLDAAKALQYAFKTGVFTEYVPTKAVACFCKEATVRAALRYSVLRHDPLPPCEGHIGIAVKPPLHIVGSIDLDKIKTEIDRLKVKAEDSEGMQKVERKFAKACGGLVKNYLKGCSSKRGDEEGVFRLKVIYFNSLKNLCSQYKQKFIESGVSISSMNRLLERYADPDKAEENYNIVTI